MADLPFLLVLCLKDPKMEAKNSSKKSKESVPPESRSRLEADPQGPRVTRNISDSEVMEQVLQADSNL
jgi:hypothetical protein